MDSRKDHHKGNPKPLKMMTQPGKGTRKTKIMKMPNNEENALVNTGPPTGTSEHLGGRPALGGGAQGLPKQTLSEPSAVDPGLSTATETITQENRGP